MEKILVQEFEYGSISLEQLTKFHHSIKAALPSNYILITTPFKMYMANPEDKLIYINEKSYSSKELLEVIEKSEMYDQLCK